MAKSGAVAQLRCGVEQLEPAQVRCDNILFATTGDRKQCVVKRPDQPKQCSLATKRTPAGPLVQKLASAGFGRLRLA